MLEAPIPEKAALHLPSKVIEHDILGITVELRITVPLRNYGVNYGATPLNTRIMVPLHLILEIESRRYPVPF